MGHVRQQLILLLILLSSCGVIATSLGVMSHPTLSEERTERQIPVSPHDIQWPQPATNPDPRSPNGSRIIKVAPNPVTPNDVSESITVHLETAPAAVNWTLSDNESTITLPHTQITGTITITATPEQLPNTTDHPVLTVNDSFSLSNAGERVFLRRNGTTVDALQYPAIAEFEIYENGSVHPRGVTNYPVYTRKGTHAEVFVLPDTPERIRQTISDADNRLYLAGYTLTSTRIVSRLIDAAERGIDVRVLIEGGPAGGSSRRTATLIDRLVNAGVDVHVVDGPRSRWRFHHAKYAVIDDRILVLTENWQPAGTGGRATRGWGTIVTDYRLADRLAQIFEGDHTWNGTLSGTAFSKTNAFQQPSPATGSFHQRFEPQTDRDVNAELLVTPDNAERRMLEVIRSATQSIRVVQPEIGNRTPLLPAIVNAARRGVTVKVLLGGTWFLESENQYLLQRLRRIARVEHLPLAVQLLEPRSRFEYLHAKGLIVDGDQVVVGSINWNTVSTRENREVAVLLESEVVGQYYQRVFRADWRGAAWRIHATTLGLGVLIVGIAGAFTRRLVTFDVQPEGPHPVQHRPSSQLRHQEQVPASRERT